MLSSPVFHPYRKIKPSYTQAFSDSIDLLIATDYVSQKDRTYKTPTTLSIMTFIGTQ